MDKPLAWNEWTRAMQVALYNATKRRKSRQVVQPIDATGTTAAFASGLYYDNTTPVGFSDLVTFSRLSGATYIKDGVLKTAAANEPRFESGGLLIEGQSTNLVTRGEDASTWTVAGVTREMVDGSAFLTSTSASYPRALVVSNIGYPAAEGGFYTASVFIKPGNTNSCHLTFEMKESKLTYRLVIDLERMVVTNTSLTTNTEASYTLKKMSDGFVRVCMTIKNLPNGAINSFFVGPCIDGGTPSAAGVGYSVYVKKAQIEALQIASSYIPTTGTAATRAADSAAVDMQPHTAGTIFAEFLSDAVAIERVVYTAWTVTLNRLASGAISVTNGAVTVTSAVVPRGSVKAAISYDGATLKLAVNGVVYSAASALPSVGVSITLGNTTFANVWQRSEAYDNARLVEVTQ